MSIHNRYADVPLTEDDFTSFDAQFAMIEEIMAVLQEPDARILRRVAKLGSKSDTFTRDALMLADKHEELLPRGLDVDALKSQMALRDALKARALQMKLLARKMEKIVQLLGSDVFSGALAAYRSMKANHRGTLNEELRELGRIFRNRRKDGEPREDEGPETRGEGRRQHDFAAQSSERELIPVGHTPGSAVEEREAARGARDDVRPESQKSTAPKSVPKPPGRQLNFEEREEVLCIRKQTPSADFSKRLGKIPIASHV